MHRHGNPLVCSKQSQPPHRESMMSAIPPEMLPYSAFATAQSIYPSFEI